MNRRELNIVYNLLEKYDMDDLFILENIPDEDLILVTQLHAKAVIEIIDEGFFDLGLVVFFLDCD